MARKYGFRTARDVKRANKAARMVLDRRVVRGARWEGQVRSPGLPTTVVQSGAGTCACGTRYARGSQTITLNSVDYEAATTLTITPVCFTGTWPFPEATFDTDHWETGAEVIEDCYTGDIQGEITIVPFYETTGSVGGTGYDVVQAWVILTNTANTCEDEDGNTSPNITAKWLCREFRPLGPTCEAELIAGSEGNYDLPKKLCIAPKPNVIAFDSPCTCTQMPAALRMSVDATVAYGCTVGGPFTQNYVFTAYLEHDGSSAWVEASKNIGTLDTSGNCGGCANDADIAAGSTLGITCNGPPDQTLTITNGQVSIAFTLTGAGTGCLLASGVKTFNIDLVGIADFTAVPCDTLPTLTGTYTSGSNAATVTIVPVYV